MEAKGVRLGLVGLKAVSRSTQGQSADLCLDLIFVVSMDKHARQCRYCRPITPGEFSYELVFSKTNQSGVDRPENHKPALGAAGAALEDWLSVSGIREGALFRRVLKGGHLGGPLSAASVRDIDRSCSPKCFDR